MDPVWNSNIDKVRSLVMSPDFKSDKTLNASIREQGIYKTVDGGVIWKNLKDSILKNGSIVIGLGVSPNYQNDRTLIVSTQGKGLLKSILLGQE